MQSAVLRCSGLREGGVLLEDTWLPSALQVAPLKRGRFGFMSHQFQVFECPLFKGSSMFTRLYYNTGQSVPQVSKEM